ncbi:uncharacterized protein LOC142349819 isoform X4 [Convolutriloba macropyga]|uniref:uncharacterized protein LOC142349819 isoform X4 n=1 Tax=Convolutriloba macropyga TaxID=536237 RepID=UPI003F51BA39
MMGFSPKAAKRSVHFKPSDKNSSGAGQSRQQKGQSSNTSSGGVNNPVVNQKVAQQQQSSKQHRSQPQLCMCGRSTEGSPQRHPRSTTCPSCNKTYKPQQQLQSQHMNQPMNKQAAMPSFHSAGYNFGNAPNVQSAPGPPRHSGGMPVAVWAYMGGGQPNRDLISAPSGGDVKSSKGNREGSGQGKMALVPNARVAFQMYHSLKSNPDMYSNYMLQEDVEGGYHQLVALNQMGESDDEIGEEEDEDDDEEDDYDQLISCSEWGDISEISYRPLAAGGPGNGGDDLTTETESVMSAALPNRRPGHRLAAGGHMMGGYGQQQHHMRGGSSGPPMNRGGPPGYDSSLMTSECETNSMIDTTDDDQATNNRFSSSTGDRSFASRLMPLPAAAARRPRKKRKKPPFQRQRINGRANSFSSITDSTMSLNIITVTLSMETTSFLGISIVGQTHKQGDGGIYVGTIMPGGAVAQDGRIEPGDMILQVNEYSFENMSNDDAVKILRDVVTHVGPIKLVVAKCWNSNPQSYLTLPKANDAHHLMRSTAGDPQSWVEATSRMMGAAGAGGARGFKGGPPGSGQGSGGPMSPSMVSVTSNDSFSSSLPESGIIYPGRADSTNYLLAAITGAPPPSAAGAPTFPQGTQAQQGLMAPGGGMMAGSGGSGGGGSVGTPGSGGTTMMGANGTPIFGMSSADFDPNAAIGPHPGAPGSYGYPSMGHLSTKTDVLTVLRAVQMPNSGVEIKDRMWLKITIPNAFLGHSLVDWLFENLDGFSVRRDAHKYASKLLKEGYIKHTTGKASFSEQCYYIFNSEHHITNMNNLSYPGDNSNASAGMGMKQRDPLEMDEENDVLAPLPYNASPWGAPQYIGYHQPQTAGYQNAAPGGAQMMRGAPAAPGFTVSELDSFGPTGMMGHGNPQAAAMAHTNGGHSSPASKQQSALVNAAVTANGSSSDRSEKEVSAANVNNSGGQQSAPANSRASPLQQSQQQSQQSAEFL